MGKIWLTILVIGIAIAFWLKNKDFQQLADPEGYKKKMAREAENARLTSKSSGRMALFRDGVCITKSKSSFDSVKIISVSPDIYRVQNCRKYKGCSGAITEVNWIDLENEYSVYTKVPCP